MSPTANALYALMSIQVKDAEDIPNLVKSDDTLFQCYFECAPK